MEARPAIHFELGAEAPRDLVDAIVAIARRRARRLDAEFGVPDTWRVAIARCPGGFACTVLVDRSRRTLRVTARSADARLGVRDAFDALARRLTRQAHAFAHALD